MVYNLHTKMKEYKTEGELLKVSEKESKSWVGKNACIILKERNHEIMGVIDNIEHSAHPNTPLSSDYLWYRIDIEGKHYLIDNIKSLKIFD